MVALVLASAYREKFGGDHIDDARARAAARTRSASGGGARLSALVLVGFMGAGQVDRRPRARRGARRGGARLRPRARARLGEPIESFFDREGEARVPRARGGGGAASCSARPDARGDRARRRGARLGARARGARRRTRSSTSRSSPRRPGGAPPARGARSRATAAASRSCTRDRAPLYESVADAVLPPGRPRGAAACAARARALAEAPRGHAAGRGRPPRRASTRCSSGAA